MKLNQRFTDDDLQRIKVAVQNAEDKISGEIVPVIVARSGNYSIANYKGSLIGGSLAFILMIMLDRYVFQEAANTLFYDPVFIFLIVILGGVLGATIPHFADPVKRLLVDKKLLVYTTRQAAETAFLEEEVFNTRQRTGIMIFVSFFEHQVIVMADQGISKVVDQKVWDKIVQDIITKIRIGQIVEAFEDGIKQCGDILLAEGFRKTADDTNELQDDLRI